MALALPSHCIRKWLVTGCHVLNKASALLIFPICFCWKLPCQELANLRVPLKQQTTSGVLRSTSLTKPFSLSSFYVYVHENVMTFIREAVLCERIRKHVYVWVTLNF